MSFVCPAGFAREVAPEARSATRSLGFRVFLTGHRWEPVENVTNEIVAAEKLRRRRRSTLSGRRTTNAKPADVVARANAIGEGQPRKRSAEKPATTDRHALTCGRASYHTDGKKERR
jgi:hypothetical protein